MMYSSICVGYIFFYVQYMTYALWGLVSVTYLVPSSRQLQVGPYVGSYEYSVEFYYSTILIQVPTEKVFSSRYTSS